MVAPALKQVANIDRRYENGDIEEYRLIVNSIFPGYLEFDGVQHRTRRLNSVIDFIYHSINELQRNKGTSLSSLDLSPKVEVQVQNSNSLLEDLRKINQLKDSPYQSDIFVEKVNQTKPKHSQNPTKVGKLKM